MGNAEVSMCLFTLMHRYFQHTTLIWRVPPRGQDRALFGEMLDQPVPTRSLVAQTLHLGELPDNKEQYTIALDWQ